MSSLVSKEIKGHSYYYIVDSKRINGKPRHVNQIYLGPVQDVIQQLKENKGAVSPLYSQSLDFGAAVALYDLAERLNLVALINRIAGKRQQGVSVGHYLLLAALNRALAPTSKSKLADWYEQTMLSRLIPCAKQQLSSQRFWDHMHYWTQEKMDQFEASFTRQLVEQYQLTTRCVVYDATNFFTFIDTTNQQASVAQRGHCKQKRTDLRIIGLSLLVSSDEEIPLFYEVYEGNKPDSKQFADVVDTLRKRYAQIFGQEADITLVFDRGNNAQSNLDLLMQQEKPFHCIGGLKLTQCKQLLSIPKSQYRKLNGSEFGETSVFRTQMHVYGRNMTIVATHNPELLRGQLQGILIGREKCRNALTALQERLQKWENGENTRGKAPDLKSCQKNVAAILKGQYMKMLFDIVWSESGRYPSFTFRTPEKALLDLEESILGKTFLFTDQHTWSDEQIVHAYRSAWHIEHVFRQMKDPDHLTVRPMWHWTNPMIRVHIFCCVLAYRLCGILQKELKQHGFDLSMNDLLDKLGQSKQLIHYYQRKRGLSETYSMTIGSEETEKIVRLLDLQRYKLS